MHKTLLASAAGLALMLAANAASADYYVTGSGSDRMVVDTETGNQTRLLSGENGAAPQGCTAGSFYTGEGDSIRSCDDTEMTFSAAAPEEGAMMPNGQPYPQGAMILREEGAGANRDQGADSSTGGQPASSDPGTSDTGGPENNADNAPGGGGSGTNSGGGGGSDSGGGAGGAGGGAGGGG